MRTQKITKSYKLSDICFYKKGSGLSKEMLTDEGTPCILYGELYTRYDYLIEEIYSKVPTTTAGIKSVMDDILIPASTTTNGRDLAIASVIKQPGVLLGGDINIFRIKDKNIVDGTFLALYLRYVKWREMASKAQGITIVHLYGKDLLKMTIELPPLEVQKKIIRILSCQRERIDTLNKYMSKIERENKFLLDHLVSGDFDLTRIKLENGKEQQ